MEELVRRYEVEKLPTRSNTARVYRAWLNNHVLPFWGKRPVTEVQPREAELWLKHLDLSPKSRAHVRHMLRTLVDFAMWSGAIEVSRNPIDLVRGKGAHSSTAQPESRRVSPSRCAPAGAVSHDGVCGCLLGIACIGAARSSGLDIDWLNQTIRIERRIVAQTVDEVKTAGSRRVMPLDEDLLQILRHWKQATEFSADGDWIFASPFQHGRLPYTDSGFWRELQRAATAAGIGRLGTHAFRHTYRSWLDAVGTPIAVQQKMMRHADIRTTLNIYGDVVTDEMEQAQRKVVGLALNGPVN